MFSLTFSPVSPFGPCSPMSPCQRKNGIFNIVIHCINCTQAVLPIVHCCFMVKHNRENKLSTEMNLTYNELHCTYLPSFKKKAISTTGLVVMTLFVCLSSTEISGCSASLGFIMFDLFETVRVFDSVR